MGPSRQRRKGAGGGAEIRTGRTDGRILSIRNDKMRVCGFNYIKNNHSSVQQALQDDRAPTQPRARLVPGRFSGRQLPAGTFAARPGLPALAGERCVGLKI